MISLMLFIVTLIGMNVNWIDTDNQTVGSLSSYTSVQAAGSPVSMKVIVSGTGGDVTKNSYIRNNIPNTSITSQVVSLAKKGTPMVVFGNGSGPRVLIVAGVHGNELPSQIAAMKLINYLNGKQIRGTVYVVPFVAPSITAKNMRYWNGKNLNRVANVAGTPTNKILNLAKQLKIMALGDFHSTRPGGVPGKKSVFCSKSPCPTSYKIAYNISKQTGSALIAYPKCGGEYAGALEDCTNLAGIPAVTCEVVSPHGTVASGSISGSYYQMLTLLRYKNMI